MRPYRRRESWELVSGIRCMRGNAKPQTVHRVARHVSLPKTLLAVAYAEPRESVRLEAVRLNGIDKSKSGLVNDFPPDPPSADQML
jgi:hypothetical protein